MAGLGALILLNELDGLGMSRLPGLVEVPPSPGVPGLGDPF